jgi:hypothetical protein
MPNAKTPDRLGAGAAELEFRRRCTAPLQSAERHAPRYANSVPIPFRT